MVKRSGLAVEDFQEDAQQFKPSRWLESNGEPLKTSPKGFMPFGGVSEHFADFCCITLAACFCPVWASPNPPAMHLCCLHCKIQQQ